MPAKPNGILCAYRRGAWASALEQLEPLAAPIPQKENEFPLGQQSDARQASSGSRASSQRPGNPWAFSGNPDGRIASVAGFFVAMAHHQQGRTGAARDRLAAAAERLERIVRCGDLGNTTTYPDGEWIPYAIAIVARREAETLIHGARVSPEIDATYLAAVRKNWRPLHDQIARVNLLARSQEWMKARDNLLQVIQSDLFDWEAAAHSAHGFVEKAAALFVLTNDLKNYERLCRNALSGAVLSQTEYAILPLLSVDGSSPELKQKAVDMARWEEQQARGNRESAPSRRWRHLVLGLAEYRSGNDEAAQRALADAREAFNLNCSGTACAYSALLAQRAGRGKEAADLLATARSQFQQIFQSYPEGLGPDWEHVAIFKIAVMEAENAVNVETQQ